LFLSRQYTSCSVPSHAQDYPSISTSEGAALFSQEDLPC
jgi:hypothetical protein